MHAYSTLPVGIDIEFSSRAVPNFKKLAARFFHSSERPETQTEFLRLFTKKEAYTKFLQLPLIKTISTPPPEFVKTYEILPDAIIAIASKDNDTAFMHVLP